MTTFLGPHRKPETIKALLLGLTLSASLIIGALVASAMAVGRSEVLRSEEAALSSLTETLSSRTEGLFRQINYAFATFELWLQAHPQVDPRYDPEFTGYIEAFQDSLGGLLDARILGSEGGLYDLPSASTRPLADASDRDFYRTQRDPRTRGFQVGLPLRDRLTGHWDIPVSYPLDEVQGGFIALVAYIDLGRLLELYAHFLPDSGGHLYLLKDDGHILMAMPFSESLLAQSLPIPAQLERHLAESLGDVIVARRPDPSGQDSTLAFHSLGFPNLVVALSSNPSIVLGPWRRSIPLLAAGALALIALLVFIASRISLLLDELGASRRSLEESIRGLEANRAARDRLFAIISHDLRSPIGGIRNLLGTLSRERRRMAEADLDESLEALTEAADSTYRLLEDLLTWSRSQREDLPLRPRSLLAEALVRTALEALTVQVAAKELAVSVQVEAGCLVYADEDMAATILRNLLSNAVKYSRPGGRVWVEGRTGAEGTRIVVRDEGEGMDAATRERVFGPLALASRPGTAGEKGTGLGLQVVKEFVDRLGGAIEVASLPGEGARFDLILPAGPT